MNKGKIKANTSAEYTRRIHNALEFIDSNLDQPIQLDDVARASHFSPFHFHRIFHAFVGETVNDYISRKRMEKSAHRLVSKSDWRVTDIAYISGYSSSANFSKAFKLYFGLSPSELRSGQFNNYSDIENSKKGKLYRKYGKVFNPKELYSQFVTQSEVFDPGKLEDMLMQVKLKELNEKPIAYLTNPKGYELDSVYATWDKIIDWAKIRGIEVKINERFAICHDNPSITPELKCRYDAAVEIESDTEVTEPYIQSSIPKGKYAVAHYKDNASKINNFITELCSHWFPESGYEPDDYPPIFNYLNDSKKDGYVEMDVYIKVKNLELI